MHLINPSHHPLDVWMQMPFGCYLTDLESVFYQAKLSALGGGHAVQMGWPQWRLLRHWPQAECAVYQNRLPPADVCALPENLPWPENSLDVVLLPHGLDVCAEPERLLAQLHRCLAPRGQLLLTGLNPGGYWRMRAGALTRQLCLRGVPKIRQMLADASLTLQQGGFMGYAWPDWPPKPGAQAGFIEHMGNRWWPHQAAVYGLVASKEQLGVRPDNKLIQRLREPKELQLAAAGFSPDSTMAPRWLRPDLP